MEVVVNLADVAAYAASAPLQLRAISLGAVFFGAMTYLGNGPNLMVRAIAEEQKVEMPSFLGYIAYYAVPMLLPLLVLVGWSCLG